MARLAFLGHKTRGKEIIELLEMFGAMHNIYGIGHYPNYPHMIYYINGYNLIKACDRMHHLEYAQYSLEEFLENFPYKIGDKVLINDDENDVYTVKSMEWQRFFDRVIYKIEALDGREHHFDNWFAHEMVLLNRKKEEDMEEKIESFEILESHCANEVKIEFDPSKFEMVKRDEGYYVVKKQPQYPKTYEECCKVLCYKPIVDFAGLEDDEEGIFGDFISLKRCRDAYWKIAGEQMGLGKSWEPEFRFGKKKYCIITKDNKVIKATVEETNRFLVFPTEEMRDEFYENFKGLIEACKELL